MCSRAPAASTAARIGSAVSWCQATSQLADDDVSKSVARNGCPTPMKRDAARARTTPAAGHGYCVNQAGVMAAVSRAAGIPARLGYADCPAHPAWIEPAEWLGGAASTVDFVDHFRGADEAFDYQWEERWIRDEGYGKILPPAIKAALGETNLQPGDIDHFCMPTTLKGVAAAVAKWWSDRDRHWRAPA